MSSASPGRPCWRAERRRSRLSGQALPRSGTEGGLQKPSSASPCHRVCASWGSTVNVLGRQALAVLAQSCDSTGALKPRRRGCFCGACSRTAGLQRVHACAGLSRVGRPGQNGPHRGRGCRWMTQMGATWTSRLCGRFKLGSIIPGLWASLPCCRE